MESYGKLYVQVQIQNRLQINLKSISDPNSAKIIKSSSFQSEFKSMLISTVYPLECCDHQVFSNMHDEWTLDSWWTIDKACHFLPQRLMLRSTIKLSEHNNFRYLAVSRGLPCMDDVCRANLCH